MGIDKYQHQKNKTSSDPINKLNDIQNRQRREEWEGVEEDRRVTSLFTHFRFSFLFFQF